MASAQELAAAIRGAVPPAELIVVVDQFERLYTDCEDAERKRFVALLRCLATDTVKVVIGCAPTSTTWRWPIWASGSRPGRSRWRR